MALEFFDKVSIATYLTSFSLICNIAVLGMLLFNGLKTKFEQKVLVFNFVLLVWQIEELMMRIPLSRGIIADFDLYASACYILIGCFLLEVVYEARLIKYNIYWIRILSFALSIFFLITHVSFPDPPVYLDSGFFGLVNGFRKGSTDILLRIWIGICILVSLGIIAHSLYTTSAKFNKLGLFFIALLIPSVYGLVFQVSFPLFLGYEIPGATILLSVFSLILIIVFKDNFILMNFANESIYSVFDKINTIIFVFDQKGFIHYGNENFTKYFPSSNSIYELNSASNFLESVSKFSGNPINGKAINEALITEERIGSEHFQYMCYPIFNESRMQGGVVFGMNVTKYFQVKSAIINSFENFKRLNKVPNSYFLELDLVNKNVLLNDKVKKRFDLLQHRVYSYFRFLLLLRHYLKREDFIKLARLLKSDPEYLFENRSLNFMVEMNSRSFFYALQISFKKLDRNVTTNNHYIYFTDVTENRLDSLEGEWIEKSIPWIVNHVFRRPIANIQGLMNLIGNEKDVYETRLSTYELRSLIDSEINDLDKKMGTFAEKSPLK